MRHFVLARLEIAHRSTQDDDTKKSHIDTVAPGLSAGLIKNSEASRSISICSYGMNNQACVCSVECPRVRTLVVLYGTPSMGCSIFILLGGVIRRDGVRILSPPTSLSCHCKLGNVHSCQALDTTLLRHPSRTDHGSAPTLLVCRKTHGFPALTLLPHRPDVDLQRTSCMPCAPCKTPDQTFFRPAPQLCLCPS